MKNRKKKLMTLLSKHQKKHGDCIGGELAITNSKKTREKNRKETKE